MISGIPEALPEWVRSPRDARHWLACEYRKQGLAVTEDPTFSDLPEALWEYHIDLLAQKPGIRIAAVIRRRDDISDNNLALARLVKTLSGWRCDTIVLPAPLATRDERTLGELALGAAR